MGASARVGLCAFKTTVDEAVLKDGYFKRGMVSGLGEGVAFISQGRSFMSNSKGGNVWSLKVPRNRSYSVVAKSAGRSSGAGSQKDYFCLQGTL